jgi:hypothetical protein
LQLDYMLSVYNVVELRRHYYLNEGTNDNVQKRFSYLVRLLQLW